MQDIQDENKDQQSNEQIENNDEKVTNEIKEDHGNPLEERKETDISPNKEDSDILNGTKEQDQDLNIKELKIKEESKQEEQEETIYLVKWIKFNNTSSPIILQNKNGPCPLIAISNVLLLRGKMLIKPNVECIREENLITYLADTLLTLNRLESLKDDDIRKPNLETNLNDAISNLPSLRYGLLVNNRFDKPNSFEYTSEMNIFDLLNINLYHGWLIDPQQIEINSLAANLSYNQLVEKIINLKSSDKSEDVSQGILLEDFLNSTASQLTVYGLAELQETLKERELAVFFRNNHFSTIYKYKNQLFLLVTDQGFLSREGIVWETLSNIDGDSYYYDSFFKMYSEQASNNKENSNISSSETNDYLLALSLEKQNIRGAEGSQASSSNMSEYVY